jgi:hypothetical protein
MREELGEKARGRKWFKVIEDKLKGLEYELLLYMRGYIVVHPSAWRLTDGNVRECTHSQVS